MPKTPQELKEQAESTVKQVLKDYGIDLGQLRQFGGVSHISEMDLRGACLTLYARAQEDYKNNIEARLKGLTRTDAARLQHIPSESECIDRVLAAADRVIEIYGKRTSAADRIEMPMSVSNALRVLHLAGVLR